MLKLLSGFSIQTKIFLTIGLFLAGFLAGAIGTAKVIGWKNDSAELAVKLATDNFIAEYRFNESGKSQVLQSYLDGLRENERGVISEIQKLSIRPVYRIECIDNDGLLAIERARTGKTNTDKSVEKVQ